jgi:hypothetical protein
MPQPLLIIACGALAREIIALKQANGWEQMVLQCLPADLHNRPERIPAALAAKLAAAQGHFQQVFVAYGDCGTGGRIDQVLAEYGAERMPGAHCYEFYAGSKAFSELADAEPGTFYLTDFLARHFERLVWQGLGLDRHPELLSMYFGNYRKLIYLAQTDKPELKTGAQAAAERLGLSFEYRPVGYGELRTQLVRRVRELA